jgi:GR25 family glycosyltransferase involved in LPS biosynthesis
MNGMHIQFIVSHEWSGYIDKILGMRSAIENEDIPNDAVICFIDAYDVLVNDSADTLLQKFQSFNADLVFGAEMSCYPDRFSNREFHTNRRRSMNHYLNSGGYIGYKYAVMRCLYWKPDPLIFDMCVDGGDQAYFIEFYLSAHESSTFSVVLDHESRIFQNMHLVSWSDIQFRNGHVENFALCGLVKPVFIHFNGGTWQLNYKTIHADLKNIMPVFIEKMKGSRISPLPLTLSEYTQILTRTCFPRLQVHTKEISKISNRNQKRVFDYLGAVYYINLDKRKDRLREIQQELFDYDLLFHERDIGSVPVCRRFTAIERSEPGKGIVGCTCSHLAVLREARDSRYSSILILEDDFQFCVSKPVFCENLRKLFMSGIDFQVCMLSYKLEDSRDVDGFRYGSISDTSLDCGGSFLRKVLAASSASAYIVHESMYDRLIDLYEWAIPLLDETDEHWNYANDQVWKRLQSDPAVNWYAFTERIGKQRSGYSDNSEMIMDYDC